MFFAPIKKVTISTTITRKEWEICKAKQLKYNYVFSQGLLGLTGSSELANRLLEAENNNKELLIKLERLMGKINALEAREAKRGD